MRSPSPSLSVSIPGLSLHAEWVEEAEEKRLLAALDASPWRSDLQRRVQHYGWRYDYAARRVDSSMRLGPLPDWAASLARRIVNERLSEQEPDQVIVNEYEPGQGISKHIDCIPCFGPTIASLSLASTSVMSFTRGERSVSVALPQRSLLVLAGEARRRWAHAIPGRKSDTIDGTRVLRSRRLSLTFRTVLVE